MPDFFGDTDPRAMAVFIECQRRMTPAEKLRAVFELTELAEGLAREAEARRHPGASEQEIFLRVAARRLDRRTMIAAYGWDPEAHR